MKQSDVNSARGSSNSFRLSVLDQSPVPEGSTPGDALRNSLDLARRADSLGYHRYWLAEHHGTPGLACNSPELMIGLVAAATSRLRVGSGGVMLPHYSPLKVAESFAMLAGLFPGRIDLGIGRAAGTDPKTAFALQRDRRQRSPDDFPDQLAELLSYVEAEGATVRGSPRLSVLHSNSRPPGSLPEPWLLGSSEQSGIWAAELGLPYVFADFINPRGSSIAGRYRGTFTPSERQPEPWLGVAAWVICADSDEEAQELALSFRMMFVLMHRGQLISVPSPETARKFFAGESARTEALLPSRRMILGTPATVRAGIESLVAEYQADELFLVNILHDHAARLRSYELVAKEFGLTESPQETAARAV